MYEKTSRSEVIEEEGEVEGGGANETGEDEGRMELCSSPITTRSSREYEINIFRSP